VNGLPVQDLLDRATLAADARWPGAGITDLEPLPGGVSSLTFAARLAHSGDAHRVVIKVAPPGLPAVRNRDVLRQARILQALQGVAGVRVPAVLFEDAGAPPFFVMEFVAGEAYEPKKDLARQPPDGPTVVARVQAAARMLARLHSAEPASLGLGDEPEFSLAEELERWSALFATVGHDLRGDEVELRQRLVATIPRPTPARVLHGDYRIGNIQFDGPRLAAIIDWEIWSLGDPRTDLAWLMAYTDPVQRFVDVRDPANQAAADAVPDRSEVLSEYLAVRPVDTDELDWFLAYCYYKIASTTAALAKRNRRRDQPEPGLEIAASTLPAVITRGLEVMEGALHTK
jgi:aminoglycoside phosphotransferase (APT) family kinase protein